MLLDENIIDRILNDLWITSNYEELKKICRFVSKSYDVDDLLHTCVEQFLINKKVGELDNAQKLYFFTKIVKNQFHSQTSKYYYQFKKSQSENLFDIEIVDEQYEEDPFNMNWVRKQLDDMKQTKDWYYGRLFELYIEEGCSITNVSKRTTIPINSVSRDINKVRKELNKKRNGLRM